MIELFDHGLHNQSALIREVRCLFDYTGRLNCYTAKCPIVCTFSDRYKNYRFES